MFLSGLLLVTALAWVWLLLGVGMDASAIAMTEMAGIGGMDGWLVTPAVWTPSYAALMFSMWWIMMGAMILPSAVPTLLSFMRGSVKQEARGPPVSPSYLFVLGYLVDWGGLSFVAALTQWALKASRLMSSVLETKNTWIGAAILQRAAADIQPATVPVQHDYVPPNVFGSVTYNSW